MTWWLTRWHGDIMIVANSCQRLAKFGKSCLNLTKVDKKLLHFAKSWHSWQHWHSWQNWQKMAKVDKSWQKLKKVDKSWQNSWQNWQKIARVDKNCQTLQQNLPKVDMMTSWHVEMLTFTTYTLTYSLTRVESRDASASKNTEWHLKLETEWQSDSTRQQ